MDAEKTGRLIAQMRKEQNITQRELAQRLHLSPQAVSKWERGLSFPDVALLEALGEELNLTVSELLAGERNAPPQEELVRDSLRTAAAQWGPKVRRWRGLFLCAAALLLLLGLWRGYLWVRDTTEWLPQPQATVTRRDTTSGENQAAHTAGSTAVYFFDVALSDGFRGDYSFQMELWTQEGLERTWPIPHTIGNGWASVEDIPRHQSLVLTLDLQRGLDELHYGLTFLGPARSGVLEGVPLTNGVAFLPMEGRAEVDPEHGAVLLRLGLGVEQPDGGTTFRYPVYENTGTGTEQPPQLHQGERALLLRMYCT